MNVYRPNISIPSFVETGFTFPLLEKMEVFFKVCESETSFRTFTMFKYLRCYV